MTFRSATAADVEIILRHRREMFREMGTETSPARFEAASRRYFEAAIRNGNYWGLLAEIGSEVVAGGGIVIADWPGSPLNFEPRRAWILNVYVDAAHRRIGIARALTGRLIEWCRQNGFQSVALHASEKGRPLYEKLGFRSTNEMRLTL